MFGAIFGYDIIKSLSKWAPNVPILGGTFGPQENIIIQACATSASGIAGLFVAGLPSMYQLDLMSENPKSDIGRIFTITLVCSFFGILFVTPLRKFFVVHRAASYYAVGILYDWHVFTWYDSTHLRRYTNTHHLKVLHMERVYKLGIKH